MKGFFTVNQLSKPHGNCHWRVEGTINGKRIRAFYRTREQAEEAVRARNIELALRQSRSDRSAGGGMTSEPDGIRWEMLCKRTEFPKLGYIIHRLKAKGIACRFNGRSFHAEHCLEIDAERRADGWAILSEKIGRKALDDARDNLPRFARYRNELPSHPAAE